MKLVGWVFDNQHGIAISLVILLSLGYLLALHRKKAKLNEKEVGVIFAIGLAAGAIPEALLLLWCSLHPEMLSKVDNFPTYLALSAICALLIAILTIIGFFKNIGK